MDVKVMFKFSRVTRSVVSKLRQAEDKLQTKKPLPVAIRETQRYKSLMIVKHNTDSVFM